MDPEVQIERRGPVMVLRLNRPDRGNTLDDQVTRELCTWLSSAGADDEIRGVVITGAGRLFCAGGDVGTLAAWRELDTAGRVEKYRDSQRVVDALQRCPIPVVAALNGAAAGAGVDLALACDLRIAASGASLTAAFASVGLVPDLGGSWFLAKSVSRRTALEFLLGGRKMPAERAVDAGLIDQVVGSEELLDTACALIDDLTRGVPRQVLAETLFALRGASQHDLKTSMAAAAQAQAHLMSTPEHEARIAAFLSNQP